MEATGQNTTIVVSCLHSLMTRRTFYQKSLSDVGTLDPNAWIKQQNLNIQNLIFLLLCQIFTGVVYSELPMASGRAILCLSTSKNEFMEN